MNQIDQYRQILNLEGANFSLIEHVDAMVATVVKITKLDLTQYILKISERANDYHREVLFLRQFADKLPVPKIIQLIEPSKDIQGAILMEYIPGSLLKSEDLTEPLSYELGRCLAIIHQEFLSGFGDPVNGKLTADPRTYFTFKFEEGLEECKSNLPADLFEQCRCFFNTNLPLISRVDGPCVAHRDFRPGNILVQDGKLKGIIDWAGARASFAEEDLFSIEHGEWSMNLNCKKAFLEGYASVRKVPDYQSLIPFLRLNKAIATIGFTVKQKTWDNSHSQLYQYNLKYLKDLLRNPR